MPVHLLLRLLKKDPNHIHDPQVRSAIGSFAGITGIVSNALLFLAKLVIGLLSGSIAIITDGFNNLTDAAASITTLLGFRMARKPADKDHPFGHARYEYLSALVVAALILMVGVELAHDSVSKILSPGSVRISNVTYIVLVLSIGVKLGLSLFFGRLGRLLNSQALLASAADSRNDVIATGAVLLSCLCCSIWNWNVDGIAGLGVALFILFSGFGIARQTISPLLGQQADRELLEGLRALILRHDKILGIHDLLVHDYGPGQCFASVHAEISAEEKPLEIHDILDDIERDALSELNVHLVIHYDPVLLHDSAQERSLSRLTRALQEISSELSVHDFRMSRSGSKKILTFDLEIPYSMELDPDKLQKQIDAKLPAHYQTVISFDRKE